MLKTTNHQLKQTSIYLFLFVISLLVNSPAIAGPPFLTDDPDPVPYHNWEFYLFSSGDRTGSTNSVSGPAIEINNGVAPNTQLHLVIPEERYTQPGESESGIGDTEFGVKYRILKETDSRPEIGIFPMAELATGDSSKNLGNGKTWYRLPIWIQKSQGRFTFDTGGGYALNTAAGQRNYPFGGLLSQYELNRTLTLGSEIFLQGANASATGPESGIIFQPPGTRSSSIWNIGGYYNFTPDFSLLFSGGHSFQGDGNTAFYLGLYRTWGPHTP
jgi:hypothetical protein